MTLKFSLGGQGWWYHLQTLEIKEQKGLGRGREVHIGICVESEAPYRQLWGIQNRILGGQIKSSEERLGLEIQAENSSSISLLLDQSLEGTKEGSKCYKFKADFRAKGQSYLL